MIRAGKITLFLLLLVLPLLGGCYLTEMVYSGNDVKITGEKGNWRILLNGKEFDLKGVGVGRHRGHEGDADYLKLAKEMGANAVRTWGIDQGTDEYLETAHQYGLMVDAGMWTNPVYEDGKCSYITDLEYRNNTKKSILDYIAKNRNHPAILFWNIGNETFFWTKSEEERIGFAKFLEEVIQEVHKIDPHHPVVYTSASATAVPYVKKYVPSLDILGVNTYGGFTMAQREIHTQLDIPIVVTEYGPPGPWDQPKDKNGRPIEMHDRLKARSYEQFAKEEERLRGYSLGGFVFLLGDMNNTSYTWWNLTEKEDKKLSFLTMQSIYTGKPLLEWPVITRMQLSKTKDLQPGEPFDISIEHGEGEFTYAYYASSDLDEGALTENPNRRVFFTVEGYGPRVKARAPGEAGIYRIYAVIRNDQQYASTLSKTISVK